MENIFDWNAVVAKAAARIPIDWIDAVFGKLADSIHVGLVYIYMEWKQNDGIPLDAPIQRHLHNTKNGVEICLKREKKNTQHLTPFNHQWVQRKHKLQSDVLHYR